MIWCERLLDSYCFFAIGGLGFANSFSDDSHYVSLGPRNGYYITGPNRACLFNSVSMNPAYIVQEPQYYALPVNNPFENFGGGHR
jgi:hypothetical protein